MNSRATDRAAGRAAATVQLVCGCRNIAIAWALALSKALAVLAGRALCVVTSGCCYPRVAGDLRGVALVNSPGIPTDIPMTIPLILASPSGEVSVLSSKGHSTTDLHPFRGSTFRCNQEFLRSSLKAAELRNSDADDLEYRGAGPAECESRLLDPSRGAYFRKFRATQYLAPVFNIPASAIDTSGQALHYLRRPSKASSMETMPAPPNREHEPRNFELRWAVATQSVSSMFTHISHATPHRKP